MSSALVCLAVIVRKTTDCDKGWRSWAGRNNGEHVAEMVISQLLMKRKLMSGKAQHFEKL
jgi:hypothetical protein